MEASNKNLESKFRKQLSKMGYTLKKSRKATSLDNRGDYMIVDTNLNVVVAGEKFDMSLKDIEAFIKE